MKDIKKVCETFMLLVFLFLSFFFSFHFDTQDVHGAVTGDQESDSDSAEENLGDVTQFGLTEALAQMANLTFMAVAPGELFSVIYQFFQR